MAKRPDPVKIMRAVATLDPGPGDTVKLLMKAAATVRKAVGSAGSREEALRVLMEAPDYLSVLNKFNGSLSTIEVVLDRFADDASRMPGLLNITPPRMSSCIYDGIIDYLRSSIESITIHCQDLEPPVMILPRGTLAFACALAIKAVHGADSVVIPVFREGVEELEEGRRLFDSMDAVKIPMYHAYKLATTMGTVLSQADFASHSGYVSSPGTLELGLILSSRGLNRRLKMVSLRSSLSTLASPPGPETLPRLRVRTPWMAEEEYPYLDSFRASRIRVERLLTEAGEIKPTRLNVRKYLRDVIQRIVRGIESKCT